jgi:hypothetical protein
LLSVISSIDTMAHATFSKTGVPRSRNYRAQMKLDAEHEKNEKKRMVAQKERERQERQMGTLTGQNSVVPSKSRRF